MNTFNFEIKKGHFLEKKQGGIQWKCCGIGNCAADGELAKLVGCNEKPGGGVEV